MSDSPPEHPQKRRHTDPMHVAQNFALLRLRYQAERAMWLVALQQRPLLACYIFGLYLAVGEHQLAFLAAWNVASVH